MVSMGSVGCVELGREREGNALHQNSATAGAGALGGLLRDAVESDGIGGVDHDAGDAVVGGECG